MPQLFLNNFQTQFIASVKAVPDSASPALELDYGVLRVSDGAAGLLLNPAAGHWYVLTAFKRSGSAETDYEMLHVTAVDNAVLGECRLTVLRGQEGTTPKSYVAGDIVELRLTAGGMGQYVQTTDARLSNPRAPTGAAGGVLSGAYPNPGFAQAMATAADLGGKVDKVAGKVLSANDYTNDERVKLANVAEQATKNAPDSQLRDRSTHTGVQAISTVTGLQNELDAKQAALVSGANVKTLNGQSLLGSGDLSIAAGTTEKKFYFHTANTTLSVPDGVSFVRFYAGGRGGTGGDSTATGTATGGGGGGFAFGDLTVTAGDVVGVSFSPAIVTVALNGTTVGTANPGSSGGTGTTGGPGGTANITGAVTNGGAYSGGAGGAANNGVAGQSYVASGGGSCGSPLGNGFPGGGVTNPANASTQTGSGGGGIGGPGGDISTTGASGGGGAGEGGTTAYGGGSATGGGGRGTLNSFTDPLLVHAVGARTASGGHSGAGGVGAGGGDFGGGGGASSTTTTPIAGFAGGLMGGGGGASKSSSGGTVGGAGGYGGGGGGARASNGATGGAGGPAFCFLYY